MSAKRKSTGILHQMRDAAPAPEGSVDSILSAIKEAAFDTTRYSDGPHIIWYGRLGHVQVSKDGLYITDDINSNPVEWRQMTPEEREVWDTAFAEPKLTEGVLAGYYGKQDPITERHEWTVYRVSNGTLVAYRNAKGDKQGERVVTDATNMVELSRYLDRPRKRRSKHKKPVQLTID